MKWALLLALVACADGPADCPPRVASVITNTPQGVWSGTNRIAVTWDQTNGANSPETHAVMVGTDGVISSEIHADRSLAAVPGNTTVLWLRDASRTDQSCFAQMQAQATIQLPNTVLFADIDTQPTQSITATFDGTRYQLFWISGGNRLVHHRTLDEDGTLGPVHDLYASTNMTECLGSASDGAGTTLLRGDGVGFVVDSAGVTRKVFSGPPGGQFDATFWFAGQFHVHESVASRLSSFPPTSTGAFTNRTLTGDRFAPGTTTLLVRRFNDYVELDASFVEKRQFQFVPDGLGKFGDDIVRFVREFPNVEAKTPGSIAVARDGAWQTLLATDSEPRLREDCLDTPTKE